MMFPRCLPTVALFALALLSQGCGKEGTEQGAVSVTEDPRAAALAAERGRALIDQPGSSSDRRILELAIEAFEEAVAMDPSHPDYAYWAGCGYHSLDRRAEARTHFARALELEDSGRSQLPPLAFADARRHVGEYLYADGDLEASRAMLEEAAKMGLERYELSFALGQVLEDQEEFKTAIEQYQLASRLRPLAPQPYYRLSALLEIQGESEAAASMQDTFERLSRMESDLREAELAVETNPGDPAAHDQLAQLLFRMNRGEEALEHVQLAARYSPDDPGVRYRLGTLFIMFQRRGEALEHLDAAAALDAENVDVQLARSQVLVELGREDEARQALARVLEISPGEPRALEALGRLGDGR